MASIVWDFFTVSDEDISRAICIKCSGNISRGGKKTSSFNTTNLISHLKNQHRYDGVLKAYEDACAAKEAANPNPAAKKAPGLVPIAAAFEKCKKFARDNPRAKAICDFIMEMMALDDQPFTIVEDKGFYEALRHCFRITYWEVFRTSNINDYTEHVTGYISKCIDDVVPRVIVRTYPNQKPRVNGEVCSALRARTAAFHSRDIGEYKKTRYELRKKIKTAKGQYREKVESCYSGSNARHMWRGLKTITDYKGKGCSVGEVPASSTLTLRTRTTPCRRLC
ncbi:hypothetical protein SKAU_G00276980 [Synaphobranchus kaupii]|uniref:BED-type domain-containing protein n=1 Tax=Synaphobranchus kaupii TaxID=118154 RepID=A0A9Q1IR58_SYNKA|nr:hypothetical protein SKAU_G00276980 [Synaphobranchus kaupii]